MARDAEMIPEVLLASQFLSEPLVDAVSHLGCLMHEEGKDIEHEEVHGEVFRAMAVVMIDILTMVRDGIEDLILDYPPGPSDADQFPHVLVVEGKVGDPAIVVDDTLSPFVQYSK